MSYRMMGLGVVGLTLVVAGCSGTSLARPFTCDEIRALHVGMHAADVRAILGPPVTTGTSTTVARFRPDRPPLRGEGWTYTTGERSVFAAHVEYLSVEFYQDRLTIVTASQRNFPWLQDGRGPMAFVMWHDPRYSDEPAVREEGPDFEQLFPCKS